MNLDGNGDKDLPELNHGLCEGNEGVKDGGVSGEANLLERDGSKANGIIENVNDGRSGALQAPSIAALQISQQQQSQNARVCWERFLHIRSLKVLLVETDDSTRHVVTALLRNCSYEVIEAANGIQAWKKLEDLTNHIDLVLTEVVMPCLSGIGLLSKIMTHKTRRNVPVIMMSSHDSMGLVFKCLSKGAVDFLVKPIRKNELKNLWQHVWRRCHSSSGSGSESGTQTQKSVKSVKSKGIEKSDDNSGSNDEDDDASVGLNVGDGSDNGSGTQSSWTKQAVEVDSPRPTSPWDQLAECPDSTCAQVIHSNAEISGNKHALVTARKESRQHEEKLDNVSVGKDQQIGVPRTLNLQLEYPAEDQVKLLNVKQTNLPDRAVNRCHEKFDKGPLDLNSESPSSNLKYDATKSSGVMTNTIGPHMDSREFEAPNRESRISDIKNKATSDAIEIPSLEQSLKRLRGVNDVGTMVQDDRNVLRRSESSAFSRYNTASNANKASGGNNKSGSPCDTSLDVTKKDLLCENQTHSNGDHPNQCSNVGSNNIDMDSTTNNTCPKSVALKNKSAITSTVKCLHPPSTFRGDMACTAQKVASEKVDDGTGTLPMLSQQGGTHQELQIQLGSHHYDHHHHHHHHHHVLHNTHQPHQHELQKLPSDHDDSALKKMAAAAPHCGSSNVLGGPVEGNAGNYSINGSASGSNHGSNHGSNGQNGSSTAVNIRGTNVGSDNGIAGKSGSGVASGSGSGGRTGNGMDQMNKFAQREAALTKFRQKRKERCFRKKVRYQSRKKLAEQRPRVRGQFVRQSSNENTSSGTGS